MDRDGRRWAHVKTKLIIGGWDEATEAVPDWGRPWRELKIVTDHAIGRRTSVRIRTLWAILEKSDSHL